MKKRFGNEHHKLSQASHGRFRESSSNQTSDMTNLKRVRFKDTETRANDPSSRGFDACSVPCEVTEAPQSSSEPKTSEFAFFKRLKQNVSRASQIPVDTERGHTRKFRPSNNVGELGNAKHKDTKSSCFVRKSTTDDIDSFMTLKDTSLDNPDMIRKVHNDHERSKSSFLIRTPTTVDLDSFLSTTSNASVKPESQLEGGDIFLSKRLKLRQQIAETLFPETQELPKECDLISLLLRRLLPESSEKDIEAPKVRHVETNDQLELHPFSDSDTQFKENCDTSMKAEDGCFLDRDGSSTWSKKFKKRVPSSLTVEDYESPTIACPNRMLLGYKKEYEGESLLNNNGSVCWSNRCGDRNLLTWRNEDYDYSTEGWSNRLNRCGDRNFLMCSNGDYDYSTPCHTSSNMLEHGLDGGFSYNGVSSHHPCRFRDHTHSYAAHNEGYGPFAANGIKRTSIKYNDEEFDCKLDTRTALSTDGLYNSACDVSFGKSGISESSHVGGYAELDYVNDFEARRERYPLLLGWSTGELDTQDLQDTSGMELDIYPMPASISGEEQYNLEDSSSLLHLPWYSCQDDHIQRHHLEEQNNLVAGSSSVPFTLPCGSEQLEPNDGSFCENILRESSFFFLPQIHHQSAGNLEYKRNCPSVEAFLLFRGTKSWTDISEVPNDISTHNMFQLLREENKSSRFLLENENNLVKSQPGHWSLMDVEAETFHDNSGTTTCGNITW